MPELSSQQACWSCWDELLLFWAFSTLRLAGKFGWMHGLQWFPINEPDKPKIKQEETEQKWEWLGRSDTN